MWICVFCSGPFNSPALAMLPLPSPLGGVNDLLV